MRRPKRRQVLRGEQRRQGRETNMTYEQLRDSPNFEGSGYTLRGGFIPHKDDRSKVAVQDILSKKGQKHTRVAIGRMNDKPGGLVYKNTRVENRRKKK